MQFFLPSLLIFLIALVITAFLAPRVTPWIAAVLALVFLTYGVYDHRRMFAYEYKQSTWQEDLKIYAPFLIIAGIILFSMYGMVSFFTGGTVPVPSMPEVPSFAPNSFSLTSINNTISSAANSVANATTNLVQSANRTLNRTLNQPNPGMSLAEAI
jgi:hypothetical protein